MHVHDRLLLVLSERGVASPRGSGYLTFSAYVLVHAVAVAAINLKPSAASDIRLFEIHSFPDQESRSRMTQASTLQPLWERIWSNDLLAVAAVRFECPPGRCYSIKSSHTMGFPCSHKVACLIGVITSHPFLDPNY